MTLGLGAGWHEREHRAFGVDYPSIGRRLDRLEEAAAICRTLLDGEAATVEGRWWSAGGARNEPVPVQPRLPLVIGGSGEKRTLRIVARYADWWNGEGDPAAIARKRAVLAGHCETIGRDPATIPVTVGLQPAFVRETAAEAREGLARTLESHGLTASEARAAAAASALAGTRHDVAETLRAYAVVGADEVIVDLPAPFDRPTLEALASIRRAGG